MKILYYIYGINLGGAETFVYNALKGLNNDKYQIDFAIQSDVNNNDKLLKLIEEKKCRIIKLTPFYKKPIRQIRELKGLLKNNQYDVIHIHANSLINIIPIIVSKQERIKIVLHAHSTKNNQGRILGKVIHYINRIMWLDKRIIKLACSRYAGEWMYGSRKFKLINNAIILEEFKFNENIRLQLRKKHNCENDYIIGHVGRFVKAKNHEFILDVFFELKKLHSQSKLFLIGDGELVGEMKKKAVELGIQDDVLFLGITHRVQDYYSLFDCMLFPSLYEGLPFTLVEAQASGLEIFSSDRVTKEVDILNNIHFISLDKNSKEWAKIMYKEKQSYKRDNMFSKMYGSVFDFRNEVKKLEQIYKN